MQSSIYVTLSLSAFGGLVNITGNFTNDSFEVTDVLVTSKGLGQPYITILKLNPSGNVILKHYTLTITARHNNNITVSKIVDLNV